MDHSFLFEILGDSPENVERLNNSLNAIKATSFEESYQAQKSLIGLYKHTCPFSDGVIERGTKYVFTIPYTYIELRDRIEFKQSEYYKKEIKYNTILMNPEIFQTSIWIFIDGKMINGFSVKFMEEFTQIIFGRYKGSTRGINDGFTIADIQNMQSSRITFMFIPLSLHRYGTMKTSDLLTNSSSVDIDDGTFSETSHVDNYGKGLSVVYPKNLNGTYETKFGYTMAFIPEPNYIDSEGHRHSYVCSSYHLQNILDDLHAVPASSVDIHLIYPQRALTGYHSSVNGRFQIPYSTQLGPLPTENMIVFVETDNGLIFDVDATITMHYLDFYEISSSIPTTTGYIVYYFYDVMTGLGSVHHNELATYYNEMSTASRWYYDKLPEYIDTYTPITVDYDIEDFRSSGETGIEYKINTYRELIEQNPDLYSVYMSKYNPKYPKVFKILNLWTNTRLRYDTSTEIPQLNPPDVFEPGGRYVISVRTDSNNQKMLMYLDNKFYYPDRLYIVGDMTYIYFLLPTAYNEWEDRWVLDDAPKLELVFLYDVPMAVEMTIDVSIANEIKLEPFYRVTVEDLYITRVMGENEIYISSGYKFYEKIDTTKRELLVTDFILNGEYYREITTTKFDRYNTIYLIATDLSLNNAVVTIRSDKKNIYRTTYGEAPNYIINDYMNNVDKRNFLLYRDGRLMSNSSVSFRPNSDPNGPHTVIPNITISDQIPVTVIHTSEKYNMVYQYHDSVLQRVRIYQKYMDTSTDISDRDGNIYDQVLATHEYPGYGDDILYKVSHDGKYIDLTNKITKPFSLEWYDIYMNGLKLTPEDIEIIGPYQIRITLNDNYPDIDTFIIIDIVSFIEDYMMQLINPDIQQVTDPMIEDYPEMIDLNLNVPLDSDKEYNIRSNILIDPDDEDGYSFISVNGIIEG